MAWLHTFWPRCRCSPPAPDASATAGTRSDSENTPTVRARARRAGRGFGSSAGICASGAGTLAADAWMSAGRGAIAATRERARPGALTWWNAAQSGRSATVTATTVDRIALCVGERSAPAEHSTSPRLRQCSSLMMSALTSFSVGGGAQNLPTALKQIGVVRVLVGRRCSRTTRSGSRRCAHCRRHCRSRFNLQFHRRHGIQRQAEL